MLPQPLHGRSRSSELAFTNVRFKLGGMRGVQSALGFRQLRLGLKHTLLRRDQLRLRLT
jgi:hypothetical protein